MGHVVLVNGVAYHSFEDPLVARLYSFHMPLFFVVSGWLSVELLMGRQGQKAVL